MPPVQPTRHERQQAMTSICVVRAGVWSRHNIHILTIEFTVAFAGATREERELRPQRHDLKRGGINQQTEEHDALPLLADDSARAQT